MTALDTNVLIYACDKSDPPRQQIALDLIAGATDGVLLWQVSTRPHWADLNMWKFAAVGAALGFVLTCAVLAGYL